MATAARRPLPPSADRLAEQLEALFAREAAARTRAQDEALLDAAIRVADCPTLLCAERRRLEAALGRGFPVAA